MPPALELKGTIASDGIFAGPLVRIGTPVGKRTPSGEPAIETDVLAAAIAAAIADISALVDAAEGEAADILGFQLAMLEDDALRAPAHAAIARGDAADAAWGTALDAEIAGYETAEDEYFRARATDLKDIRDRVLCHISGTGQTARIGGAILLGEDLAPTRFLETDWSRGGAIALVRGSTTSHVAMLARARGVPMIVGLGDIGQDEASEAIVDAVAGKVVFDPPGDVKSAYGQARDALGARHRREQAFLLQPGRRRDGTPIEVFINVASVAELDHIDPRCCDGIGLMRSEFLFADGKPLPDEDAQFQAYRRFVEWSEGRPVTIRTLDIGGDKPVAGLTPIDERNPFLGVRGIRLTLSRPDVFAIQLRALARAAAFGPLKIMIPMVTVPDEIAAAAELLDRCVAELTRSGIACARPPLGIMVEVPAVAICPELFAAAAFFSIGSNDLTQYVTAASRDEPSLAALGEPAHPAVLRLIAAVTQFGRRHGMPVSLCGDMASDTAQLQALLDAGLTSLSVAPARVARVKAALAEI